MTTFPRIPPISMETVSSEPMTIRRTDLWGLRPEVGASCVTAFYYLYEGENSRPLYFDRRTVKARLRFRGFPCLEIETVVWNPGDIDRDTRFPRTTYTRIADGGTADICRIERHDSGEAQMIEIDEPLEPWMITVGERGSVWTVVDEESGRSVTKAGPIPPDVGDNWTMSCERHVLDTVILSIGDRSHRCVRAETHFRHRSGTEWIVENFTRVDGRHILARGYESEKGDQYAYVEGRPEILREGVRYRLLCDMLHDYSLEGAADAPVVELSRRFTRYGRM